MKKKIIISVIILILVIVSGIYFYCKINMNKPSAKDSAGQIAEHKKLYQCPMHPTIIREKPGDCPICGMRLVEVKRDNSQQEKTHSESKKTTKKKIKYWQAPMDPTYISDKPGKSPMGMDLIPVYEEEGEAETEGAIRIDPSVVQNIGVKTKLAVIKNISREIITSGIVKYDETRVKHIHTKFNGWVEKLYVDFTGKLVKKNAPLFEIYSPELVSTQEEYLTAYNYFNKVKNSPLKDVVENAKVLLNSSKQRLKYWDITDEQIKELENTKKIKKTLTIYSPIDGFVIDKNIYEGMYITPKIKEYTIADISNIWIEADIYEYELLWIKLGQKAIVEISYYPDKKFEGKVIFIYPYLDPKTRTVKVRMEFKNNDYKLKPDMFVNVILKTQEKRALVVPEEAVIDTGKRKIVIKALGQGRFKPVDVETGIRANGYVEITKGIKNKDKVVTSAQFLLDSESKLKEAINKMLQTN